jgi:SAM-dependent methyltransferase
MLKRIYRRLFAKMVNRLPADKLFELVFKATCLKVESLPADEALVKLFELDDLLYGIHGVEAIRYNNGIHPKHDILRYKEWFRDEIRSNDIVLDVGCNTGLLPSALSSKASFVYGIEILENLVEKAKIEHACNNVEFICADATSYDYSNCKPIDCVTLSNVLEHIENRVEFLLKLIKQVKWSKEDDKRFIIRVPMINRDWRAILKKDLGCEWRLDKTHYTEYTKEDFGSEMAEAGIKILEYDVRFGEIYAVCRAI